MKKILLLVSCLFIFAAGCTSLSVRPESKPAEATPEATMPEGKKTVTVQMTENGFDPALVVIQAGDTVEFKNTASNPHWPASGVHPTHQLCPGFDALKAIEPEQTYSYTFKEKKECPMHDHLNPQVRGKVVVQ